MGDNKGALLIAMLLIFVSCVSVAVKGFRSSCIDTRRAEPSINDGPGCWIAVWGEGDAVLIYLFREFQNEQNQFGGVWERVFTHVRGFDRAERDGETYPDRCPTPSEPCDAADAGRHESERRLPAPAAGA